MSPRRRSRARRHTVETVQAFNHKQELQGVVKSDKMDKTIVVEITMRKLHPLYKKYVTKSKSIKAHDEKNEAHEGDTVRVMECRPLSRDKRWRLVEVVEKAK
jgi:small subunit ribosomal protein S17